MDSIIDWLNDNSVRRGIVRSSAMTGWKLSRWLLFYLMLLADAAVVVAVETK